LKANQGNLYEDVTQLFKGSVAHENNNVENQFHTTLEKGHGRIEIRRYSVMGNTEYQGNRILFVTKNTDKKREI
jgi:hypothetical protein